VASLKDRLSLSAVSPGDEATTFFPRGSTSDPPKNTAVEPERFYSPLPPEL